MYQTRELGINNTGFIMILCADSLAASAYCFKALYCKQLGGAWDVQRRLCRTDMCGLRTACVSYPLFPFFSSFNTPFLHFITSTSPRSHHSSPTLTGLASVDPSLAVAQMFISIRSLKAPHQNRCSSYQEKGRPLRLYQMLGKSTMRIIIIILIIFKKKIKLSKALNSISIGKS